jgi:hypothetical protein
MKKIHYVNRRPNTDMPYCANRVDMAGKDFKTTEAQDEVTCRLCLMRLGVIPDTRGNWDNRTR